MSIASYCRAALLVCTVVSSQLPGAEPAAPAQSTLVDSRIRAAEAKVKEAAGFAPYNDLAAALLRKARDTSDVGVYQAAGRALEHSLQLSKDNYEARKLQVEVLLGEHEFSQALQLAAELNHRVPDDLAVWAELTDANSAMGNYAEAEKDAQWVLDLRPGNTPGFIKAAELRELFGDLPGAVEFWDQAIRRTSANDTDQRAWLLVQKARLQLVAGYDKEAEGTLQQAFQLFPDSLFATEVLAHVRVTQGKGDEAADLFEKRYRAVKSPANLYDWAQALEQSGQSAKAAALFGQFQTEALAQATRPYNANLQLIDFKLRRQPDLAGALVLAAKESSGRHDCRTLETYAWALYRNGRFAEAKKQMDQALAVGIRDPLYFCHAAQIASRSGDARAAQTYRTELATFKDASCVQPSAETAQSLSEVQSQ